MPATVCRELRENGLANELDARDLRDTVREYGFPTDCALQKTEKMVNTKCGRGKGTLLQRRAKGGFEYLFTKGA